MERVVHKSNGFKEAEEWDIEQQVSMPPEQRMEIAKIIRDRVYPGPNRDVRECHRDRKMPHCSPLMSANFSRRWKNIASAICSLASARSSSMAFRG